MRKSSLLNFFMILMVVLTAFQACKDDSELTASAPIPDQSFTEEFDSASAALSRGWVFKNTSDSIGGGVWQDGGELNPWFRAYSNRGNKAGFIGADYTSTSAQSATISNWLISPSLTMQNGDKISFYTRAVQYYTGAAPAGTNDSTDYGNRLRVCINPYGDDLTVGQGLYMGNYVSLYDINPDILQSSVNKPVLNAYPTQWTRFEVTVSGLAKPMKARFAFQYNVEHAGSNGNGSGVAIDLVRYTGVRK